MKILILSDIHDNIWALNTILQSRHAAEAGVLICCGDLCSPFIIDLLAVFKQPVHIVLGNNDCDVEHMVSKLPQYPHIKIHGEYYRDELDNKTIAVSHYPEKAEKLVQLQAYDVVGYGHDHSIFIQQQAKTLLLNPGAVMGFAPRQLKDIYSSFMVYDTRTAAIEAWCFNSRTGAAISRWDEYCLQGGFE